MGHGAQLPTLAILVKGAGTAGLGTRLGHGKGTHILSQIRFVVRALVLRVLSAAAATADLTTSLGGKEPSFFPFFLFSLFSVFFVFFCFFPLLPPT